MKDTLQILRDGVRQDIVPIELPLIANMSLLVRIKDQEKAGLLSGGCGEIPLVSEEGEEGGRQHAPVIQSLLLPHTWHRQPHHSRPRGAATVFLYKDALLWQAQLHRTFQGGVVCGIY